MDEPITPGWAGPAAGACECALAQARMVWVLIARLTVHTAPTTVRSKHGPYSHARRGQDRLAQSVADLAGDPERAARQLAARKFKVDFPVYWFWDLTQAVAAEEWHTLPQVP